MLMVFGEVPNHLVRYDDEHCEEDVAKLDFVPPDYEDVRGSEDTPESSDELIKFGCTLSICPARRINSRRWEAYSHLEQLTLLVKIVNSLAKWGVFVDYSRLVFEVCPALRMLHVHFMASSFSAYMSDFAVDCNQKYSPRGYTTFKASPIYDEDGWALYMKKILSPNNICRFLTSQTSVSRGLSLVQV